FLMKNFIKKHFIFIAIASIIVIINLITINSFNNEIDKANNKAIAYKELSEDYKEESEKKSDIELLEFKASQAKNLANKELKTIESYKLSIVESQDMFEFYELTHRCYSNQMTRKTQ
ncbi:MAG: hypothetical protein ACPHY8_06705, partial [Patescibacteria group bacterium]